MIDELHQALLVARVREGPLALSARQSLAMATSGGERFLGREREIGSIEDGKLADIALWRVDGLAGEGIEDPVCTLVFGTPALERLFVSGQPLVTDGHLTRADEIVLARDAADAAAALRAGAERWT